MRHHRRVVRVETHYQIPFPREAVWPVLSKTDWINRALGLPAVQYDITANPHGGSIVTGRSRIPLGQMRWREFPFEWLEPDSYRAHRLYETGPFTEAWLGLDLLPTPDGGTAITCFSEIQPRHFLGAWLFKNFLGPKADRDMRRIIAQAAAFLGGQTAIAVPQLPTHPPHETALRVGLDKLRAASLPPELIARLETFLRDSPDVELAHIRPLVIARRWQHDSWEIVKLFLHATRSGLLDFSWEILCPNCRSTQNPVSTLGELQRTAHCDICQIEFDGQFDKSVELKFAIHPAIRPRENQIYCLVGPGGTPHVLSQLWLEPGESRVAPWPTPPRPLRIRSPQVTGALTLDPEESPTPARPLTLTCAVDGFILESEPGPGISTSTTATARFLNPNTFPLQLSLEQIGWGDDILTAARATNWQEFRDLFSSEVISPGEQITVGAQVILFTDLRGSTAMYHGLGDAPAYARVRDHFLILTRIIGEHHGTLVKTIGDAVMASFSRVDEALAAIRAMHRTLQQRHGADSPPPPLVLKSSLHVGPCLAVNANGRLDYFGTTINLAARMISCCQGGDLAISDELYQRPEIQALLQTPDAGADQSALAPEPSQVQFRGFPEPHLVWRVPME